MICIKLNLKFMNRIILKINKTCEPEAFTSLKGFFLKYPEFKAQKDNINSYLSRKKEPFEAADFTLFRLSVY